MSAMTTSVAVKRKGLSPLTKRLIWLGLLLVLIIAMLLSTRIVPKGSQSAAATGQFSAAAYGRAEFPKLQKYIAANAVDADTLSAAVHADTAAAEKKYGKSVDGATWVIPVTFTGVVGKLPPDGYTPIDVAGLPPDTKVGLQLGPAINGTDLRDVTGKINLNDFDNQIQYQDAGSAINNQLKKVLDKVGASGLTGKTVTVQGAFTLVNPNQWNVTPSQISVGK